jgi:hypothetical protein
VRWVCACQSCAPVGMRRGLQGSKEPPVERKRLDALPSLAPPRHTGAHTVALASRIGTALPEGRRPLILLLVPAPTERRLPLTCRAPAGASRSSAPVFPGPRSPPGEGREGSGHV